ncbi:MAG: lipoyl(octanoyl) transferase LipB [Candidatus Riflebacteria bacterium]|nr:lipoyl(octanoyl) transferase LipB [Candidatus Riflebacteria bacterium]
MPPHPLDVRWLGRVPYREAWELQRRLFEERAHGAVGDTLLLMEHPPTITLGRSAKREHVLAGPEDLARRGVEVVEIDRGGDVTFHGPGQLVGYPILDLSPLMPDVQKYVRALEEVMLRVSAGCGVPAGRVPGMSGIWSGDAKIGAIGVKVKQWITMHGFALNVNAELAGFGLIVPCGLAGKSVTSLHLLAGHPLDAEEVRTMTVSAFAEVFGLSTRR